MIFSPAPWFRILFLFLAAIVITGIFAVSSDGSGANLVLPAVIAAVCIIAALYEESWIFDREKRIIVSRYGLLFLRRKKVWSFAEIENIELYSFLRGAESDGKADHKINIGKPFSRENTDEVSGRGIKIIHPKYHQELRLNLKNGDRATIESLDSRSTDALEKKAGILADFSGLKLFK